MKISVHLLAAVSALSLGALGANASASREAPGHLLPALHVHHGKIIPGQSITGTWLASYDGGVHIGYIQFQKGGTLWDMMDFAPKTGNLLMGDWTTDGRGTYTVLVAGLTYDNAGKNRTGYFTKTEDENFSGDTYTGTFEVTYYDLGGNITFQHDGTVTALRIESQ